MTKRKRTATKRKKESGNGVVQGVVLTADCTPHPENYNEHPDSQIEYLKGSIDEFGGQVGSIVVQKKKRGKGYVVVDGNGFWKSAWEKGIPELRVDIIPSSWSPEQVKAYMMVANESARLSVANEPQQAKLLQDVMKAEGETLALLAAGTKAALAGLLAMNGHDAPEDAGARASEAERLQEVWQVETGDLFALGDHRLICGDCTDPAVVERVMGGERAILCHADPPYGMGKEKDGVANDNLYREKLDTFQMAWWRACRPHLEDNASAYIWGNAEDLWRLWYVGGLRDSERLTLRNQVTWDKYVGNVKPTVIEMMRSYVIYREDALFFMLGEQGFNNNADNYWEGWEPIRAYLAAERDKMGWDNKKVAAMFDFHPRMASHWFDESQWSFIRREQYEKLQRAAANDAFKRDYEELKREFYATRAYFDNTHDNMTDVWQFGRVQGDERHEHATPKPVDMMERVIKSSAPDGGIVLTPFAGTWPEVIAGERTGRKVRGIELTPIWCAVALQRYADTFHVTPERIQ